MSTSSADVPSAPTVDDVHVGMALPGLVVQVTRGRLVRYAGASTDFNPIHYSEHFAAKVGLPGVIAHGMLTMGLALEVVTNWVQDPRRVRSYTTRFTKPVVVPDTEVGTVVELSATVLSVEGDMVTLAIEAVSDGQKVLGAARAEVDLGSGA